MIEITPTYQTPQQVENATSNIQEDLLLTPWVVQNIGYELITKHLLTNTPRSMGFPFDQTYDLDKTKSSVFVDLGFNWNAETVQKRPAVFVTRTDVKYASPVMQGRMGTGNSRESVQRVGVISSMGLVVKCIATNIGFAESWAEYIKQGILPYQWLIQHDFGFMKFRLEEMGEPKMLQESKEHFNVPLFITARFTEGWRIRRDDLKLKTVSCLIYDGIAGRIFT